MYDAAPVHAKDNMYTLQHNLDHVNDIYCFVVMLLHFAVRNEGCVEVCLVLLNVSSCSVHLAGSEVSCIGAAAQGTAGHRRQQAVSFCLVSSYEKGHLQARCLLQGKPPACMRCLLMHPCSLIDFVHVHLCLIDCIGAAVGVNEDAMGSHQDAVGVVWNVAKAS